ncbi:MAG: thioredoxin family protein [Deltaproteobacteria bacterium]|nr:thioredoxin family protein [Deltaproteobacteria bacterium]
MRTALVLCTALLLSSCAGGSPPAATEPAAAGRQTLVRWHTLAEAKGIAAAEKKPLLVDYYVPQGCNRCELMERKVYGDPEIAREINEHFAAARVDLTRPMTDDEKELGRRYDFNFDCLLLFLDPEGNVLKDAGGGRMCFAEFVDPKWFAGYLSRAREEASRR